MLLLTLLVFIFSLVSCAHAFVPTDWAGSFQDNVFGGLLNVCVSYDILSDTYYAQGVFSMLGYIRGTVDPVSAVWTGEYCLAGMESRSGNFSFSLAFANDVLSYSGQFLERPGIPYMMYGNQTSSVAVSGIDCMEANVATIAAQTSTAFAFTGEWYVVDSNWSELAFPTPRWIYQADGRFTQSYLYGPEGAYQGYSIGNTCMNGQVAMANWYENGDYDGLYLFVAKNDTVLMSRWVDASTVSDFQYGLTDQSYYAGASYSVRMPNAPAATLDLASTYSCYQINDATDEELCYDVVSTAGLPTAAPTVAPASSGSYTGKMLKAILICGVLTLVVVLLFFGHTVLASFQKDNGESRLLASHVVNSRVEKTGHNDL